MEQTLIQKYASAIISAALTKADSIGSMRHNLSKGQLRELFITDLFMKFLPHQFDIGSGIIVNQKGEQSNQTDLVIYDKSILPPFISESISGIFPIESVIATIEIKSKCSGTEFNKVNKKANYLNNVIANGSKSLYFNKNSGLYNQTKEFCKKNSIYPNFNDTIKFFEYNFKPMNGLFVFSGYWPIILNKDSDKFLEKEVKNMFAICYVKKISCMNLNKWKVSRNVKNHYEIKRFIAILIDNILTRAKIRKLFLNSAHFDFNSIYIRDQESHKKFFEEHS